MNNLLAAVLIFSFFPGWIISEPHSKSAAIQRNIREALHSLLGAPQTLRVFVWENSDQPHNNPLDRVMIIVRNGSINDLPIYWGKFEFQDLALDMDKLVNAKTLVPLNARKASLNVQIRERDVNRFLQLKTASSNVRNAIVQFEPDRISISGYCKWWFIDSRFEVDGTFTISKKRFIEFSSRSIRLSELKMPKFIVRRVMDRLNPILDISALPFPVLLNTIRVSHDNLYLSSLP